MRRTLFTLLLLLAALPTAAVAQLPPLPPTPTLPAPPVPPPLPSPTPPPVPLPVPVPQPSAVTSPVVGANPGSPATPAAGSGQTSGGASPSPGRGGASGPATTPKRRPSVVLAFRASSSGRLAIRLTQVAPVCRNAGRLLVPAQRGANRFRFNGRVSGRPLRDGTYVATTQSDSVRFAIVRGKPTRSAKWLAPSVCVSGELRESTAVGTLTPTSPPKRTAATPAANVDLGATEEPRPLPQVLGAAFTDVAEAAASIHPLFYLLLALAIVALAAATVPARVVPVASAGAVLARHRAAVTLAGTLSLLVVIVVYWATLL